MKEASIGRDQAFIPHDQAAETPEPSERALHDPPPPVATQLAAILMRRPLMVGASGDDGLDASTGQPSAQWVTIIASIRNQALGSRARPPRLPWPPDGNGVERLLEERDLRWGRRRQVCSHRSTRAIDHHQPLRSLAPLGLADFRPPFFAEMKLPSAKHSSQRSFCWSLSWAKKARHSLSKAPVSSHCLRRRQQVLALPYRRGSSLHWAPVQRIQRMPSKQHRSSTRGRPPRGEALGCGRWIRIVSHCCLVSLRHAMCCPPVLLSNSWRYHTLTGRF
jgi:hypothetical protein